jgi:hypothetical protein
VINLIKHWLEGYYDDDFVENAQLTEQLRELIEKIRKTNERFEQVLLKTLQKKTLAYAQKQLEEQQQLMQVDPLTQKFDQITLSNMSVTSESSSNIDFSNLRHIFKSSPTTPSIATHNTQSSSSSVSSRSSSTSTTDDLTSSSQNLLAEEDSASSSFPPFETHLEHLYPYDLLTLHPLEFARQATLMEEEIFKV